MSGWALRTGVAACALLATGAAGASQETIQLKDSPGHDLTAARYVTCHSLDYLQMNTAGMDYALRVDNRH